ncbi:hypothetical protein ACRRTK_004480 [Alexandromys fortis]
MSYLEKLNFLNAVATLCSVVRYQANGNMNNYYPKTLLAKKIEVKPPFHLCQKLDLVNVSITSVFSLPPIMPSIDRKDSASLYLQTIQALDDMLHALVLEQRGPDMLILQNFIEIILPWLMMTDKVHEQTRALGTISRLLRFICNFSELSHMVSFSIIGRLIGTFSIFCLDPNQDVSSGALEALYYLFTILVLQRSVRPKTETILKDLQKHFRGNWLANMQNLTLVTQMPTVHGMPRVGGKYLTPVERADVIMVAMEAMTSGSTNNVLAASKTLKVILKYPLEEIAKVPEIIQLICFHIDRVTDKAAQSTIRKTFHLLVQSHTDEVILTLYKTEDPSQRGTKNSWEILDSFPKGYQVIMKYLLQKLISPQTHTDQKTSHGTELSTLIVTRAIHELLLIPSQQSEVQTFFASLFVVLLFQISVLVTNESPESQDKLHETVSSSIEAMKTLLRSSGYIEHMSYIQTLRGWELVVSPESHYEGVTLLARSLVVKNCWHNRPVFSFLIKTLEDSNCANYLTALVFLTELLRCPDVAGIVDEFSTKVLVDWFKREEPAIDYLFLQITEIFTKHKNTMRHFHILQSYVLSCCYSSSSEVVTETFLMLRRILRDLTWRHASSFITELVFTLVHFFEEESEELRLITFQIYGSILTKVSKMALVCPLRHQILNLLVLLVSHLQDVNANVVEVCRISLCSIATFLGWSKLKGVFSKNDVFMILSALLQQERSKALWFLKQSVALFKSPQGPVRQVAVWFAGQIIRILNRAEKEEIEDEFIGPHGQVPVYPATEREEPIADVLR